MTTFLAVFGPMPTDLAMALSFSVRIAAGDDMKSALTYANVAASLSTEKFGAQTGMPTAEEVEKEMK